MTNEKTLEDLRAVFAARDRNTDLPNNYYRFWDMQYGETCTIRLLPDLNSDNPMGFLVEKRVHNLTIAGERKTIPCLTMYGEDCPICKVSQAYYKQKDEVSGKKYWRNKQYIAQAILMEDPLPLQEGEESRIGTVRYSGFGWSIFSIFKDAISSGEFDTVPYAFKGGSNFIIKKQKKIGPSGREFGDYTLSNFARKETDLSDEVIAAIEDQLIDLSTLLPSNPGLERIEATLEAEMTGTPAVNTDEAGSVNVTTDPAVVASGAEAAHSIETSQSAVVGDEDVDEVLAAIRQRKATRKA